MTTAITRKNITGYGKDALTKFRAFAAYHPVLAFASLTFALPIVMLGAVSGSLVLFALPFVIL